MYYLRLPYIQKLIVLYIFWIILCSLYYLFFMRNNTAVDEVSTIGFDIDKCLAYSYEPRPQIISDIGFRMQLHGNMRSRWEGPDPIMYCLDGFKKDFDSIKNYLNEHPDKQLRIIGHYSKVERNKAQLGDLGYKRAENLRQYFLDSMEYDPRRISIGTRQMDSIDLSIIKGVIFNAYNFSFQEYNTVVTPQEARLMDYVQPIFFEENFATMIVSDSLKAYLIDVINFTRNRDDIRMLIVGNTNSNGPESENMRLGLERARFIEDHIKQFGIIHTRCISLGESRPKFDNNTEEGLQKNRRVDLQLEKIK